MRKVDHQTFPYVLVLSETYLLEQAYNIFYFPTEWQSLF